MRFICKNCNRTLGFQKMIIDRDGKPICTVCANALNKIKIKKGGIG
jgi:hypothetical protein